MKVLGMLIACAVAQIAGASPLQIHKVYETGGWDLFWDYKRIVPLTIDFHVDAQSHVSISGGADIVHRGAVTGNTGVIEYACIVGYRGPVSSVSNFPSASSTVEPTWIQGTANGGNIYNLEDHYGRVDFDGYQKVTTSGWYRVEVWCHSRSSLYPNVDGLSEINAESGVPLNALIVRVEEAN